MDRGLMIALADRSPEMVARKDRQGWLGLFSPDGVVDDPVGAGPNRKGRDLRAGKDGLGRFYDIFIGPNRIDFDVHRDIAAGDELARDVSIKTTFGNGAVLVVHCIVLYRFVEDGGQARLESLRAHWNFARCCRDLITGNGFKGLAGALGQFGSMVRVQGPGRVIKYSGVAYRGILRDGARKAAALAAALSARDGDGARRARGGPALSRLVDPGATVDFPAGGATLSWAGFLSGPARGVRLELRDLRSGGWFTCGGFRLTGGGPDREGIVLFEFSPRGRRIVRARFFWE